MVMDSSDSLAVKRPSLPGGLSTSRNLKAHRTRRQASPKRAVANDETPRDFSPLSPKSFPPTAPPSAARPTTTKWTSKALARRAPSASSSKSKSLSPLSERRYTEEKPSRPGRAGSDTTNAHVAPHGSSAGREDRQFIVANVGNNGRIYLRPSVRPAHQPYPQPNFTFPITPPSTAIVDSWNQSSKAKQNDADTVNQGEGGGILQTTPWTPNKTGATPLLGDQYLASGVDLLTRPRRHGRALSDSTVHEASINRERNSHIHKATVSATPNQDDLRPRTMDDLDFIGNVPVLDVKIPSWRLGTPRFTLRGTPLIRGSSYAPTDEDPRSSTVSGINSTSRAPNSPGPGLPSRRPKALVVPSPRTPFVAQRGTLGLPSPRLQRPSRATYTSTHAVIEPAMFTDLTFKPTCDDSLVVRYSAAGSVTAATAPRLVAEITSPSFLDYELISDFFLTYRSFLEPSDLLRMLVARLRWALDRDDQTGMIVRVRTFVAIRHWILNYFLDDFLVNYSLRVTFCNLLNDFVDELSQDVFSCRVQLKILSELKKCWRRICAQFWNGDEFDDSLRPEVPISPGDVSGTCDPNSDPISTLYALPTRQHQHDAQASAAQDSTPQQQADTLRSEISNPIAVGDFVVLDNRPGTPENQMSSPASLDQSPASPCSLASVDILSCSFPSKHVKNLNPNMGHVLAAHPVPSTVVSHATGPIATTPKTLIGKRVRPMHTHKRSNSLSDSLRDHKSDRACSTDKQFLPELTTGGSLVRGNLLPPGQAYVNIHSTERCGHSSRQSTVFQPKKFDFSKDSVLGSATSSYGMRKLLRSVRKALKNRGQGLYSNQHGLTGVQPAGPRGVTINRLPGTAIVPQGCVRQNGSRPPVRIDLLGAKVAEDFKKAIREEEEEAAAATTAPAPRQPGNESLPASLKPAPLFVSSSPEGPTSLSDSTTVELEALADYHQQQRPVSDMAMTVGSKSILILDGTVPYEIPAVHEAFDVVENPSVHNLSESFMRAGVDPTPPSTPASQSSNVGTLRKSSCLISQHITGPYIGQDVSLPFVPDLAILEGHQDINVSEDQTRPFVTASRSGGTNPTARRKISQLHCRGRSWKSQQSFRSILHDRATSPRSAATPPTLRGFNVSSDSADIDGAYFSQVTIPEPLRVLRRRPGGDLRAVTNIGDLNRSMLRRSPSLGSIPTYTESICSSYMLGTRSESVGEFDTGTTSGHHVRPDVFSLGQIAEKPRKRDLSLFSTHSSKHIMRPSFEAEAKKLAQIPDDEDGGIESALLKLEGKFLPKKTIKLSMIGQGVEAVEDIVDHAERRAHTESINHENSDKTSELSRVNGTSILSTLKRNSNDSEMPVETHASGIQTSTRKLCSFLSESSHDSYCSIPLLQRGLDDEPAKPRVHLWNETSFLRGSDDGDSIDGASQNIDENRAIEDKNFSFDVVHKTVSMEEIQAGGTLPSMTSLIEDASFLKDDSIDGSHLCLDLSEADDEDFERRGAETQGRFGSDFGLLTHASSNAPRVGTSHPLSARMNLAQALNISPEGVVPPVQQNACPRKSLPPTPELTPVVGYSESPRSTTDIGQQKEAVSNTAQPRLPAISKSSVHLPFILAFDSDVLAQQLTLIEKDALTEIDWRELIEMDVKRCASSNARSWVEFLRNIEAQGVDVVVARFNIMVKWAMSEIVLTQNLEERARCIIKLIHIAAHCRRYRNFATLAQLTIALSSNEVSRLSKTWELVPDRDLKTLRDLEILVTPSRNFRNIRAEMEVGTDGGCIPFVGIYTHDLLYNAQRPSEIVTSPVTAPLVNFERFRCSAMIVKTLLRLLEASTRYTFQPLEGVTERCLWIGALSDIEIRKCSQSLD